MSSSSSAGGQEDDRAFGGFAGGGGIPTRSNSLSVTIQGPEPPRPDGNSRVRARTLGVEVSRAIDDNRTYETDGYLDSGRCSFSS
jgi:hypothetical protein